MMFRASSAFASFWREGFCSRLALGRFPKLRCPMLPLVRQGRQALLLALRLGLLLVLRLLRNVREVLRASWASSFWLTSEAWTIWLTIRRGDRAMAAIYLRHSFRS